MNLMLVMVWTVVVLFITEEGFDRLRRANDYGSWWWGVVGVTRIVLLFGALPVAHWLSDGGAQRSNTGTIVGWCDDD